MVKTGFAPMTFDIEYLAERLLDIISLNTAFLKQTTFQHLGIIINEYQKGQRITVGSTNYTE